MLLLDLGGVYHVVSAGLPTVLLVVRRVNSSGNELAPCSAQDSVRQVLDITGFTSMFSTHRARSDAITAIAG